MTDTTQKYVLLKIDIEKGLYIVRYGPTIELEEVQEVVDGNIETTPDFILNPSKFNADDWRLCLMNDVIKYKHCEKYCNENGIGMRLTANQFTIYTETDWSSLSGKRVTKSDIDACPKIRKSILGNIAIQMKTKAFRKLLDKYDGHAEQELYETYPRDRKCFICQQPCGYGNNPQPIPCREGDKCCDDCNVKKVLPCRLSHYN